MNYLFFKKQVQKLSIFYYILIFLALSIASSLIFGISVYVLEKFGFHIDATKSDIQNKPKGLMTFFSVCLIAPIIETLIGQMAPIVLLKKYLNEIKLILISAAIFGLFHWYSLAYIFNTFLVGIIFSTAYIYWNKPTMIHPFWIVCAIHSLRNLISFLIHT